MGFMVVPSGYRAKGKVCEGSGGERGAGVVALHVGEAVRGGVRKHPHVGGFGRPSTGALCLEYDEADRGSVVVESTVALVVGDGDDGTVPSVLEPVEAELITSSSARA